MSDTPLYDDVVRWQAGNEGRDIVRRGLASKAVGSHYAVPCPTCGAEPFAPCRTRKTRRVTDTHMGRIK